MELSAAYSPTSNGEANSAVKRVKHVITHSDSKVGSIRNVCHNINWEQKANGTGSAAKMFVQ